MEAPPSVIALATNEVVLYDIASAGPDVAKKERG
jgi:hypothetical protein